jgi:Fe-S-cluster containining protein
MMLGKSEKPSDLINGAEIITLDLDILGEPLHFRIAAWEKPAKLSDIVPLARVISSEISEILQKTIIGNGRIIPCQKGCTVCCYYMVLLSAPEAFRLLEETTCLSLKQCGDVIEGCSRMAKKVQKYLSKSIALYDTSITLVQQREFSDWYYKQKRPCFFLHNNLCSIYEQRPIACQEYLIADTAFPCSFKGVNEGGKVDVPISIRQALKTLTCTLTFATQESIVLPCVFDWYRQNLELSNRTWPAVTMAKKFVKIIKAMEAEQAMQEEKI